MALQLIIGNKNYSSWSMRPWVLMRQLGLPFDETLVRLDFSEGSAFRQAVAPHQPRRACRCCWTTASRCGTRWPSPSTCTRPFRRPACGPPTTRRRARARSLCAEMHSGFGALRTHCPMNIEARLPEAGARASGASRPPPARPGAHRRDVGEALQASGGPMLFGAFSAADAFYAPVCARMRGYALPVSDGAQAYIGTCAPCVGVAPGIAEALAGAGLHRL
jgi:glutathione S-transferase